LCDGDSAAFLPPAETIAGCAFPVPARMVALFTRLAVAPHWSCKPCPDSMATANLVAHKLLAFE